MVVNCTACGAVLRFKVQEPGKKYRCPKCKSAVEFPAASENPESPIISPPPDIPIGKTAEPFPSTAPPNANPVITRPTPLSVPMDSPPSHTPVTTGLPPQFIVHIDGEDFGPIDQKELQLWAYEERIEPGTLVRLSNSDQWMAASQFSLKFSGQEATVQQVQQTVVIQNQATQNVSHGSFDTHHPSGSNNGIAAICSFLLPGLGQFVQGRAAAGIAFLIGACVLAFPFIFPAIIVYLWSIIDAAVYKPPRSRRRGY